VAESYTIRAATVGDAARVAELSGVLGYPAGAEAVAGRLGRLLGADDDAVLVAEAPDGEVAGWVHAAALELLESGTSCEIMGLIVAPEHRDRGVGRGLIAAVEAWATGRGLTVLEVSSNVVRPEAHAFYERLGFERVKTQHEYCKRLPATGAQSERRRP
jgi:ribosomal protein S18 acetylase RimI-like enzyme